jgi:hypothetical protein
MWSQVNEALRQSVERVLSNLAGFLPGALVMLAALVLALILGLAVRWLVTGILRLVRFDQRMGRWGASALIEWSPSGSPTLLLGRLGFWVVILLGILVGLAAMDATLMPTMLERLVTYLPNVFVAVVLVLLGSILARFLSRGALISAVNLQLQSARLLSTGVRWLVLLLTFAMALDHLSVGGVVLKMAFAIVFGGIVLALALAVGLGSKDVVSRTWERQVESRPSEPESPMQHL